MFSFLKKKFCLRPFFDPNFASEFLPCRADPFPGGGHAHTVAQRHEASWRLKNGRRLEFTPYHGAAGVITAVASEKSASGYTKDGRGLIEDGYCLMEVGLLASARTAIVSWRMAIG